MTNPGKSLARAIGKGAGLAVLSLLIGAVFLFLIEGFSSFVLLAGKAFGHQAPLARQRYTRYDPQLGWVSIPNTYVADMYGPGAHLRINSQGFRGDEEVSRLVPAGKIRVICSGDSFTLGYGVSDDRTWCHDLALIDRRLETVNMGQGGYGLDQAYLWYARDGVAFNQDVHIFAFIGSDLRRMASDRFEGYFKPTLAIQDGHLVTRNVPVPQIGSWGRWVQRLMAFRDLQSVALMRRVLFRNALQADGAISPAILDVADRVFDQLAELNRKKKSQLVVAFLPTEGEYRQGMPDYIAKLKKNVLGKGIMWIDLMDDFRRMPAEEAQRLFLTEGDIPRYKSAAGHYTNEGNDLVARLLYRRITEIPAVAAKLSSLPKPGVT